MRANNPCSPRTTVPLVLALLAVSSCKDGRIPAPYEVGQFLDAIQTSAVVTTSYKMVEGAAPVEQKGTVGTGLDCRDAGASSGTRSSVLSAQRTIHWDAVGETPWDHPLLPGKEFGRATLSIIENTTTTVGNVVTRETFRNPDLTVPDYDEKTYDDAIQSTEARYYGVAADEYLVKATSLDLWSRLTHTGLNPQTLELDYGTDWLGVNSTPAASVLLMSKHDPKDGDVWTSLNGNYVFFATGKDELKIGKKKHKADRILIKTTGTADPANPALPNLVDQCLKVGRQEFVTDHPDTGITSQLLDVAMLDAQCEGSFAFQVVGNEWWADNALVKAVTTTYAVSISEWGYEWYQMDPTGSFCTRTVSPVKDDPSAQLFIQYDYSTVTSIYEAQQLGMKKKKERGPSESAVPAGPAGGGTTATQPTGTTGATGTGS